MYRKFKNYYLRSKFGCRVDIITSNPSPPSKFNFGEICTPSNQSGFSSLKSNGFRWISTNADYIMIPS